MVMKIHGMVVYRLVQRFASADRVYYFDGVINYYPYLHFILPNSSKFFQSLSNSNDN